MKMRMLIAAALAAILPAVAAAQGAATFPDKPVKFVLPVAPGGTTDVIARVVAARLTTAWGQPVVVENKAGGSGLPAMDAVVRAKPDGYTLFVGTIGTLTVNPHMFKMDFDPLKDFTPVTLVASAPTMLTVTPSLPVNSVKELIAYGKANPGKLFFGSPSNGTSPHLAGELFKQLAGIDATHVPYKGASPALTDLMAGRLQFMFDNIITSLPLVKDGRLRALAVTSTQRSKLVPDLPTMAEAGLPGQEIAGWVGIVAPAGTPKDIVDKIQQEIAKQLRQPGVAEQMTGAEAVGNTPEEFGRFMRSETEKWGKVVREAKISVQ